MTMLANRIDRTNVSYGTSPISTLSGSERFGSGAQEKRETIAEIAALLAFSAIKNNDRVGLILFSDRVERFVPPKKGKGHVMRVVAEILNALVDAGWTLERVVEPLPLPEMKAVDPRHYEELSQAPAFICIRARA